MAYPPVAEIAELWGRCTRADMGQVGDYLGERHINASAVADRDLARVMPGIDVPIWAAISGRTWFESGHRLLVPRFDASGNLRSLVARSTTGAKPKSVGPSGFGRRGLIMADGSARRLRENAQHPAWWRDHEFRIVVVEGETDFLIAATAASESDEYAHATLGIFSGSFTAEIAQRVPAQTVLVLATDDDDPGERYALAICQALRDTGTPLHFERWRPSSSVLL